MKLITSAKFIEGMKQVEGNIDLTTIDPVKQILQRMPLYIDPSPMGECNDILCTLEGLFGSDRIAIYDLSEDFKLDKEQIVLAYSSPLTQEDCAGFRYHKPDEKSTYGIYFGNEFRANAYVIPMNVHRALTDSQEEFLKKIVHFKIIRQSSLQLFDGAIASIERELRRIERYNNDQAGYLDTWESAPGDIYSLDDPNFVIPTFEERLFIAMDLLQKAGLNWMSYDMLESLIRSSSIKNEIADSSNQK